MVSCESANVSCHFFIPIPTTNTLRAEAVNASSPSAAHSHETGSSLTRISRITPAAAALGTILRLKPVLQIQGEKLDAFAKARTISQGKSIMINAIRSDMEKRFGGVNADNIWLQIAYTYDLEAAQQLKEEVQEQFPGFEIHMDPLSLSVACHIGPGALAVACCKKIQ